MIEYTGRLTMLERFVSETESLADLASDLLQLERGETMEGRSYGETMERLKERCRKVTVIGEELALL